MRPIDADALNNDFDRRGWDGVQAVVDLSPTIDAVPVVRCKDCLYWQSGENECDKWEYCTIHNIGIGPHSFCSYGERKEADGNG